MDNLHAQFEEDLELYELSVLDGPDLEQLEAHLAGCAECRAKLAESRRSLALLALAASANEPPEGARNRVLEAFRESHPPRPEKAPAATVRTFWTPLWAWACAAASVVLLVSTFWLAHNNLELSGKFNELAAERQQLQADNLELKASAAHAQAVLDVLNGPQTIQVDLSPQSVHPVPHAKAFYNRDRGLVFYTTNLNALPSDKTYELWLIPTAGKPVDLGIFKTDSQGNGEVMMPSMPQGLTAKAFAVSVEPAGGVPAPTGPIVLVGPVS